MTITSVADAPAVGENRERDRWAARRILWSRSTIRAVRWCGRVPRDREAGHQVMVRTLSDGTRIPGLGNMLHCASVHSCPVCSAAILAQRAKLVATAIRRWRYGISDLLSEQFARRPASDYEGGVVAMLTLTVRHGKRHALAELLDGVAEGMKKVLCGKAWQLDQEKLGVPMAGRGGKVTDRIGWMRVLDTTVGPDINGWHPHIHMLLFLREGTTDKEIQALGETLWKRWDRGARAVGLEPGVMKDDAGKPVGMEIHRVTGDADAVLGEYFGKAAFELVGSSAKAGRGNGHYSPMQLLASLVRPRLGIVCIDPEEHGPACQCSVLTAKEVRQRWALWGEWEQASKGRRQISISMGLLPYLGLGPEWEPDDERDADFEAVAEPVSEHYVSSSLVDWLNRNGRIWELLDAGREGDWPLRCTIEALELDYGRHLAAMLRDRYGPEVARLLVDDDVGLADVPAHAAVIEQQALRADGRDGGDAYDLWGDRTTTGVDVLRSAAEHPPELQFPPDVLADGTVDYGAGTPTSAEQLEAVKTWRPDAEALPERPADLDPGRLELMYGWPVAPDGGKALRETARRVQLGNG